MSQLQTSRAKAALAALGVVAVCCFSGSAAAEQRIGKTDHAPLRGGTLQGYASTISLPADGLWTIRAPKADSLGIQELYLMPKEPARLRQLGDRMFAALEDRHIQNGRWQVQRGFEACREYAQEHDGVGPKSVEELASDQRWEYLSESWENSHWGFRELSDFIDNAPLKGPFVHLIPNARFRFANPATKQSTEPPANSTEVQVVPVDTPANSNRRVRKVVPKDRRAILAFELRPFADDGKHWVLYTDGDSERVEIDSSLVRAQKASIRPIVSKADAKKRSQAPKLDYVLAMVASQAPPKALKLVAYNRILDRSIDLSWEITSASKTSTDDVQQTVSAARKFSWSPYLLSGSGGVLRIWNDSGRDDPAGNNGRPNLSTFSVLGGRSAVEETLQMQNIGLGESNQAATIDIDSVKGVTVTSHPFEEMLGDAPGGGLEMANYVPSDRFFFYVGKPESLPALLDSGAPFIASMGATLTGNSLQYNLESRYLARLGMTRDWVDAVLTSGLTSELAVFTPDLFFIDGTDVTVVAKLRQPQLLRQLLSLLGVSDVTSQAVVELPTDSGDPAFLALREDLLFASTNRNELDASIELWSRQGEGSLGVSVEFRYMLTQLPVSDQTRMYAYFSDPFVRRLVGPRVKIGQRRRVLAKAKMEALTAQAMLAKLDGNGGDVSLADLISSGHVPEDWRDETLSLDSTGIVRSEHYGSLPRMRSLPEIPIEKITPEEAEAYRIYVENYSRYWRRYFDPIAVRIDEVGTDQLELSTFILPLVDNSIYNGLKGILAHQDDQVPLSVPIVEPKPVVQFSANLKEEAWQGVAGNFSEFFTRYSGASPAMLDDFGPSVHVAIFDADPIIAIGSGDVFGAFGGNVLSGTGDQMLMLPVALSMLTRPCSIMVETKAPERTVQYLRQAASGGLQRRRSIFDFSTSFYQVEDRDAWVWTMDMLGVVKLRYGVEVSGQYLVIRNIPWSSEDHVVSTKIAELNAAVLRANPSACEEQLPGLFAAASDANRRATMSGLGRLYPFMLSGAKSVSDAANQHRRLYGFYPRQLPGDQWTWKDYRMVSRLYGMPTQQRQPAFDPDRPFGLMNRIDFIDLTMQFEDDGLRSTIRWRLR